MTVDTSETEKRPRHIPLVLSLLMGLIFVLPSGLMPLLETDPTCHYSPLNTTTFELEETVYASGIREVFDGRFIVRDAQLYEKKDSPSFIPKLPHLALGLFARILGSVPRLFIVSNFLFPAIIFLLVYTLMFRITGNVWVSSMGGVVLLLGYHLVPHIPLRPHLLVFDILNYQQGIRPIIRFSRLPYNQFSFTILIGAALLIYLAAIEGRKAFLIPAGIACGLTFSTYFYHYTCITVVCGTMFLIFSIQKEKKTAFRMLAILSVMALSALPFFISYLEFAELPQYQDILSRMGMELKTINFFSLFVFCQVLGYLLVSWLIVKQKDISFFFMSSFLAGGALCYLIPVVLGFGVQSFHWSTTALDPFIIIFICYVFSALSTQEYLSRPAKALASFFVRRQKRISIGLILFFALYGAYTHTRYSLNTYTQFCLSDSLKRAFQWINDNTDNDAVVASNSIHSINLIPAYTHCNNYIPNALMTVASSEEIIDRLCLAYRIFQVPEKHLDALLSADNLLTDLIKASKEKKKISAEDLEKAYWSGTFFHAKFVFAPWNYNQPYRFPEEIKERISKSYMLYVPLDVRENIRSRFQMYKMADIHHLLSKYRLDYLLYGPYEKAICHFDTSKYDFLKRVYDRDGVEIYQVLKQR